MILLKLRDFVTLSPSITSWLNLAAKSLGMLALIPLVNSNFSELDRFFWFTLTTSWSLVLLLDVGLNATVTRYFSYLNSVDNLSNIIPNNLPLNALDVKSLTILISRFYYGAMFLVVLLIFPAIFFSIYEKIIDSPTFFEYILLMIATSAVSLLYLLSNAFNGITQGLGYLPKVQLLQLVTTVISLLAASTAIFITENISITVTCFYTPFAFYFFAIKRTAYQKIDVRFSNSGDKNFKKIRQLIRKRLFHDTLKSGVGILSSQGYIIGTTMLINKTESIDIAIKYMICMQVIRAISSFSQVPFYSRIPVFCQQYALKKYSELGIDLTRKFSVSILLFIAMVLVFSVLVKTEFGDLIFGSQLEPKLWIVFGCTFLCERIGALLMQVYTITGDIKWHIINFGAGILSVSILFLMPMSLNVFSVLGSIFFSYLLFVIPYISFYIVKEPNLKFPSLNIKRLEENPG